MGGQFKGRSVSRPTFRATRAVSIAERVLHFTNLAQRVRAHLGQGHRYEHVVRVARCADVLAQIHGVDTRKARLAGMLHDLARLYSAKRLLDECDLRGMEIDEFERANPIVLHARLGASLAQESFGVHDPAVLSAIEKHTVAAAQMSPLDCVIYLADGLEPGRTFPERDELWRVARTDLHAGMRATIAQSIGYLERQGLSVAPQTLAAAKMYGLVPDAQAAALAPEGVTPSLN